MRSRKSLIAAAAAVFLGLSSFAQADSDLLSPGGATPGWYDGTGNPNGGFTVTDTNTGIELGLRAKDRQDPTVIHPVGNTYTVHTGLQTNPVDTKPPHAAWNYEYSVNLGTSGYTLATTTTALTVTDTEGDQYTVPNVFSAPFANDSFIYVPLTGVENQQADPLLVGATGGQNSENPIFINFPLKSSTANGPYIYNPNKEDIYTFTLDVYDSGGALLAQDSINVQTVAPLPSVAWGGLAMMGSLAVVAGVKRNRQQLV